MKPERLEEIKQANQARTPGKWLWFGYKANRDVALRTYLPGGGGAWEVLSFRRWGMRGAQPVFYDWVERMLRSATELFIFSKEDTCTPIITDINNPDARFIAKAPEYVTELLELVDEQAARIKELESGIEVPN